VIVLIVLYIVQCASNFKNNGCTKTNMELYILRNQSITHLVDGLFTSYQIVNDNQLLLRVKIFGRK